MNVGGKYNPAVSLTIRDITFKMNATQATIFSLTHASFYCYKCTFHGMMTAVDFKWGSSSDLIISRSTFKGVVYGIKAQYMCGLGKLEISDSSFNGERGASNTGFQLISSCFRYPQPDGNVNIRMVRTHMTGFSKGMDLYISDITLFKLYINECHFSNQMQGSVLVGVSRRHKKYTKIAINGSSFRDNEADSGGALMFSSSYIDPANVEVNITNCTFERNKAKTIGGAVALKGGMMVRVKGSFFAMNECRGKVKMQFNYGKGSGGALGIDAMRKVIYTTVEGCTFKNNVAASFGGAIYTKEGPKKSNLHLSKSTFESYKKKENPAVDGDLIYSTIYTKISHVNSLIQPLYGGNAIRLTGQYGSIIDRYSEFKVSSGNFFQLAAVPVNIYLSDPMLSNARSGLNLFGAQSDKGLSGATPSTMQGSWDNISSSGRLASKMTTVALMYQEFSLNFFECPYKHYNLNESVFKELKISNSNCQVCPEGGICLRGKLKSKENFWGYLENHGQPVKFIRLLDNYGCTGKECAHYNSCAEGRTGQLCATCRAGFSEDFLSTTCIPNNRCNSKMFWLMACIFITMFIPLYLYKKEFLRRIRHHLLWFWRQKRNTSTAEALNTDYILFQDQSLITAERQQEPKGDDVKIIPEVQERQQRQPESDIITGFLKICFYFYQIEAILNMQASESHVKILKAISSLARNIFNLKFTVAGSSSCSSTNATPVQKILLRLGLIALILLIFVCLYTISLFIERYFLKKSNDRRFSDRVLPTLFEIFLMCYAVFVSATFKVINCVNVNGKLLLYQQGNLECYVLWQYFFITVAIAWVIPFCIVVFLLPHLLKERRIKEWGLFVVCVFPFPYIIAVAIHSFLLRRNRVSNHQRSEKNKREDNKDNNGENNDEDKRKNHEHNHISNDVENQDDIHTKNGRSHALDSILANMTSTFIKGDNEKQYVWWDGVLIFRRLVIISVGSLIKDPYTKLYLLLLVQILFLLHHMHAKPFNSGALNAFETLSLTLLTLTGATRFVNVSNGSSLTGDREALSRVFAWLRIISTSILPISVCLVLCVLIILKMFRGCFLVSRFVNRGHQPI